MEAHPIDRLSTPMILDRRKDLSKEFLLFDPVQISHLVRGSYGWLLSLAKHLLVRLECRTVSNGLKYNFSAVKQYPFPKRVLSCIIHWMAEPWKDLGIFKGRIKLQPVSL
jgi:hypothetical protein